MRFREVALLLVAACLPAQTMVRPWQIRCWDQVNPSNGPGAGGTQVPITQILIRPDVVNFLPPGSSYVNPVAGVECYSLAVLKDLGTPDTIVRCSVYPHWIGAPVQEYSY
jgi:hypothetical protein